MLAILALACLLTQPTPEGDGRLSAVLELAERRPEQRPSSYG